MLQLSSDLVAHLGDSMIVSSREMIISVAATVEDLIADGRAALRRGDVAAARGLFQTALTLGPNSTALEGLGFAAYLAMDFDEAIDLWQQSYAGYRADGNGVGAVRMARMLGYLYGIVVGDWAIGSGWIARAQHLLAVAADFVGERVGRAHFGHVRA